MIIKFLIFVFILIIFISSLGFAYNLDLDFDSIINTTLSNSSELLTIDYNNTLNLELNGCGFFNFGVVDSKLILNLNQSSNSYNSNITLENKPVVLNSGVETFVIDTNKFSDYFINFLD